VDRPIVAVDRIGVESLLNSEGNSVKLAVRAIIKNSGRTPALKMRGAVNLTGRASVIPDDFDYPDVDSGQLATVMLLAPNQEMRSGDFLIDVAYADRVRAGVSHMFLYGWIEYDDSFEGGGRHRTEFCYKIEVAGNPRLKRNPLLVSQHGPYNCIDKSCRYATGREPPKSRERQFPPNISPD